MTDDTPKEEKEIKKRKSVEVDSLGSQVRFLSDFAVVNDQFIGPQGERITVFPPPRGVISKDEETAAKARDLEREIQQLRENVYSQTKALQETKQDALIWRKVVEERDKAYKELTAKEELGFLLNRVNPEAQRVLLRSDGLRKLFLEKRECHAFVMSVDIRRSTELMLKAREPEMFASFITTLCSNLEAIVKQNYGVFDKFTGDGVLAFFPNFFSGKDAGFYAVSSADSCHKVFDQIYREHRSSFIAILNDTGLGIGIDHGPVHLVQVAGGLTVVGDPVVYACRMGGAPARKTYLNQRAYEEIAKDFGSHCSLVESEIDLKHEGKSLCYEVSLNSREYEPELPEWVTESKEPSPA